jgi:hypothetical protein
MCGAAEKDALQANLAQQDFNNKEMMIAAQQAPQP